MGESKNFQGGHNPIHEKAVLFAEALKTETGLTVHFEPEFYTSAEAGRVQFENQNENRRSGLRLRRPKADTATLDASAAALILKNYLEKRHNSKQ